ncbi:MAG: AAA family ATPase, partial [Planctomycetaceae bacterium]|nr:AAA family ATPase [Planctomycetaceae bacterium]
MNQNSLKRLPYGMSDFRRIRIENYVYVDKTRFIETLESENNSSHFFIRPRKF